MGGPTRLDAMVRPSVNACAYAHTTVRLRLNGVALTDLAELTRLVVGPAA